MDLDVTKRYLIAIVRVGVLLEKVKEIPDGFQKNAPQHGHCYALVHLIQMPIEKGGDAGRADMHPLLRCRVSG